MLSAWRAIGLAVLSGLLLAAGQAPFSVPYGVVLALPLLAALLLRAKGVRAGFRIGWFAGAAYFAGSMFWIVEPFFVEPEIFGWMAPFALIFLAGGLALFWGLGFGVAAAFNGTARLIVLVFAWTGAEYLRSTIFTGFPWGLLAYTWSETPVFQMLAVVGPHGLGAITVMLGVMPLMVQWRSAGMGVMIAGFAALWVAGMERVPDGPVPLRDVTVRIVQVNAPQHLKWHPDHIVEFFQRGLELSRGDGTPVDVVLWPETALPFGWGEHAQGQAALREAVGDAQFIGGMMRRDEKGNRFNSMVHLGRDGAVLAIYDKYHLVPFGEYIPFPEVAAKLGLSGLADQQGAGFKAGSGQTVISAGGLPPYIPLICYEAIFPGYSDSKDTQADWILHLTNDAWFGIFSGPYQHLVQARARAIEQGLPVVRVANTGVSAVIDPYGRIIAEIPLNTSGYLDAALPMPLLGVGNVE